MTSPTYWQEAIEYLSDKDPILANLITIYPNEAMTNDNNAFATLVKAIIGQQISIKAAATICQRLESLIGNFDPESYLQAKEEELRQCGISRPKIRYIGNVAHALDSGQLTPETWPNMNDNEVSKQLISISGIGTWTAQMFLIFHLHRSDILPLGDIGLINAIKLHYGAEKDLDKSDIKQIAKKWQPYRTVATWYLWRSLDPIPVQY